MIKNKDVFTVLIRLFLGYIFFSAGVCKLSHGQFGQIIGPHLMEEALAKHGLGLFAQVVAVFQVLCGALLMSQRFSLLGAIMLVPMNVAILAVTVSMNWTGTPYVNAVFLSLNLLLLFMERQKFSFLFNPMATHEILPTRTDALGQNKYSWIGLAFSLLIMIAARYSLPLTNTFAIIIFINFALAILTVPPLSLLDKLLVILPFVAMLLITYSDIKGIAAPSILVMLVAETALLGTRLYMGSRAGKLGETPLVQEM
ncbi:DoxX family membrane protein [Pontibacter cellulosilyticus]|uniref:DoxX family membrane protein n=1 Tax=Pontibacter cellulosilyticus TaxID=1720253 RepID=A0A923N342_9BACT|nr:DoxX family membrane protein [Pontibacter cellulosilyticus]MBC5992010.1 DoxX family membrane protein [Pontibacter cellulosilyticus]